MATQAERNVMPQQSARMITKCEKLDTEGIVTHMANSTFDAKVFIDRLRQMDNKRCNVIYVATVESMRYLDSDPAFTDIDCMRDIYEAFAIDINTDGEARLRFQSDISACFAKIGGWLHYCI